MLLACLVGLAANAQYRNTETPVVQIPVTVQGEINRDYAYAYTPVGLSLNINLEYIRKIGFSDFVSDLKVENSGGYRLYKARNPETGDECWITYNYNSEDKPMCYGVAYVFKDKKMMPEDFKKLAKTICKDNYKYCQWKNRLVICENYFGVSETENILKTGKYKVPSSVGNGTEYEKPIKVIIVNK